MLYFLLKCQQAQDAESRGDNIAMEKNARTALILDICGAVTGAVTFACVVLAIIIDSVTN